MDPIYVTGHKNPDTDSIVSAIAYAALRNALGEREYLPARLGHLSDETQRILDRFQFNRPVRIHTMATQVCDLVYDTPPALNAGISIHHAWRILQQSHSVSTLPITYEDGTLYGMLSSTDIAAYDMQTAHNAHLDAVPIFNLLSVLEGKLLNNAGDQVDAISGEVVIALPQNCQNLLFTGKDSIVLCGCQPELVQRALEMEVCCIILCQAEMDPALLSTPSSSCIISTPLDAYRAVRQLFQAAPIGRIAHREHIVSFHLNDFVDDVQEEVLKTRYRCYPILDEQEKVVGTLSRYHLLRPRRKRVVLVDHNEAAQSVAGLEQAEVLGIIDHHRLADIQTANPVFFRNEPVGSTTTIVARMFQEHGLMPSERLAGLMAAAILSDTVLFKSPTCTQADQVIANRLARIANVNLEELGQFIFSAADSDTRSTADLLFTDFKIFHIAGHSFGISQITCVDSLHLLERKDEFLQLMGEKIQAQKLDLMILMLTDVLLEGSQLIYLGPEEIITQAFGVALKAHTVFLPKVMSRKKQMVPALAALWG